MLINAIILCKCEVFKEKSALQGVKAVSEWKECERKSKSVRITGNNFDSNHKKQQTFHNNRHNFGEVSRQTSFDRVLPIRMIEQPRESNERKQANFKMPTFDKNDFPGKIRKSLSLTNIHLTAGKNGSRNDFRNVFVSNLTYRRFSVPKCSEISNQMIPRSQKQSNRPNSNAILDFGISSEDVRKGSIFGELHTRNSKMREHSIRMNEINNSYVNDKTPSLFHNNELQHLDTLITTYSSVLLGPQFGYLKEGQAIKNKSAEYKDRLELYPDIERKVISANTENKVCDKVSPISNTDMVLGLEPFLVTHSSSSIAPNFTCINEMTKEHSCKSRGMTPFASKFEAPNSSAVIYNESHLEKPSTYDMNLVSDLTLSSSTYASSYAKEKLKHKKQNTLSKESLGELNGLHQSAANFKESNNLSIIKTKDSNKKPSNHDLVLVAKSLLGTHSASSITPRLTYLEELPVCKSHMTEINTVLTSVSSLLKPTCPVKDLNYYFGSNKISNLEKLHDHSYQKDANNTEKIFSPRLLVKENDMKRKLGDVQNSSLLAQKQANMILDVDSGIYLGSNKNNLEIRESPTQYCPMNLPGMIDDSFPKFDKSISYRLSGTSCSSMNLIKEHHNPNHIQGDVKKETVNDLMMVLNDLDCPSKYSVNAIKDPIRKCGNISSIHLGDYEHRNKTS